MITMQKLKTILSALIKYKIDPKLDQSDIADVAHLEYESTITIPDEVAMVISDDGNGNVTISV